MKKSIGLFACLLLGACASYNTENGHYVQSPVTGGLNTDQLYDDVRSPSDTTPVVDPAGHFTNVWDRVHHNFKFHYDLSHSSVKTELRWFLRNQAYFNRVSGRARPYLAYIIEEIEKRHLPGELALLPVLESAYNPYATSSAQAVGLWQLMYGTARLYGVKQTAGFNGRRDIRASTQAALDLLTHYNKEFNGDWLLTLAAYNAGDGTVAAAIRRNQRAGLPTDFWSLPLPAATRQFVPRILALASIVAHPKAYGMQLVPISNTVYFKAVNVDAPLNLAIAAKMADVDLNELHLLNPAYTHANMDAAGPYELLLPAQKADLFAQKMAAGDLYHNLAMAAAESDNIKPLRLASRTTVQHARFKQSYHHHTAQLALADHAHKPTRIVYHVRPGDSLDKIARHYRVETVHLAHWNNISQKKLLQPGQKLTLYVDKKAKTARG